MAEAPRAQPMSPEQLRAADAEMQNRIMAEVAERDPMNGPDGGRYKVGDQFVDANGNPVKDKKD